MRGWEISESAWLGQQQVEQRISNKYRQWFLVASFLFGNRVEETQYNKPHAAQKE
jgi:hypothetical protein